MVSINQLYSLGKDLATNPKHTRWMSPIILVLEAALCYLIILKVPCPLTLPFHYRLIVVWLLTNTTDTEIDWKAYMQQIQQYVSGERDYTNIKGGTGPLVYPAAHVYIYQALYNITDNGTNIRLAQYLFGCLYLAILALVLSCYRQAKVPPYILPMLVLSKRLHSIFVLRCFNDCFAVFFLWAAIYCYQKRLYTFGSLLFSWGLGIKMSLLLCLPAFGLILFLSRGVGTGLRQAMLMAQVQVLIALPFLKESWQGYLGRAFEFSRIFFFKWTVNWRFIGEETFLSKSFHHTLLLGHVTTLAIFALTRWLVPAIILRSIPEMVKMGVQGKEPLQDIQHHVSRIITPTFVLTTILSCNVIGILFARSLHYQFFAYLAWSTPFLLWRSGMHPLLMYVLWTAQEWAWNVYPSTNTSSMVVVGVLAAQVLGVWVGTRGDAARDAAVAKRMEGARRAVESVGDKKARGPQAVE